MGSLNFIALQNGESVASTSWCFGRGFSNWDEGLSPVQAMLLQLRPMGEGKED